MDAVLDKPLSLPVREERIRQIHEAVQPLLDDFGSKNHVRVVVHRAMPKGHGKEWKWGAGELVHSSVSDPGNAMPMLGSLVMLDEVRILAGRKPIYVDEAIRRTGGEYLSVTRNLRVTAGIDYVASALGDSSGSRAAVAQYIALSNSTGALAASDTATTTGASGTGINWGTPQPLDGGAGTGRGEYTALGLARALATYAHTATVTSYTMTKTFTATSPITAVQTCGLFNATTQNTGTLFVENNFTATSLATSDQLTITWTVNI